MRTQTKALAAVALSIVFLSGMAYEAKAVDKDSLSIPPKIHQRTPPKVPLPKPVGLKYTPDDPWDKLFVQELVSLKERVQQLEAKVAQLEAENSQLMSHRHDYQDRFIGGNLWLDLGALRKIIKDGEQQQLNNFGIYFRAEPLTGKGFPTGVTEQPK